MLIGLGHRARQGKDIAGQAIVDFYNNRRAEFGFNRPELLEKFNVSNQGKFDKQYPEARIFKFAEALYEVCRNEFGMQEKDGSLLQKVGDGRREQFGHDYWIKQLAPKIKTYKGIAVITDVRYLNEANWVKALDGHVVNVSRLNLDGTPFVTTDRDPNFISEVQLDGFNYDYYIKAKTGQSAWVAEQAITLAEYLRGLES